MKDHLLNILERNAALSIEELSIRLNSSEESVLAALKELIAEHKIVGYKAILPEITNNNVVQALIEVKVAPRREGGFDTTAQRIARFSEVTDLALVSGTCDLLVTVRGDSLQEVAAFISAQTVQSIRQIAGKRRKS